VAAAEVFKVTQTRVLGHLYINNAGASKGGEMHAIWKWISTTIVLLGIAFFAGLQSGLAQGVARFGESLGVRLMSFVSHSQPSSEIEDWSGVWKIYPDNVNVFIVDTGNRLQWFFNVQDVSHVFIGEKSKEVASGHLYRRTDSGCVTEYTVDGMRAEKEQVLRLTAHYHSAGSPECGIGVQDGTKTFTKQW
jgi:hypothetical protein